MKVVYIYIYNFGWRQKANMKVVCSVQGFGYAYLIPLKAQTASLIKSCCKIARILEQAPHEDFEALCPAIQMCGSQP